MGTAYVGNEVDSFISIIDTSTQQTKGTIDTAYGVTHLARPANSKLWFLEGQLAAIANLLTNKVTDHVHIPHEATGIATSRDGLRTYVCGWKGEDGFVWIINTTTKTIIKTISLEFTFPVDITLSPDNRFIYVVSSNPSYLIPINRLTQKVLDFIETGGYSSHIAISPTRNRAYVTNSEEEKSVSVVDLSARRVIKTIQLKAEYPEYIAVTPDQKYAYITHPPTNRISVINLANSTLLRTFTCLGQPEGLAMTLDNRYVYIAQYEKKRIAIFNRSSGNFLKTINVGRGPREIVITQDD